MNIGELTTEQKSVMLARLMGWRAAWDENNIEHWAILDRDDEIIKSWTYHMGDTLPSAEIADRDFEYFLPDLYRAGNMYLAWRVLNWAAGWIQSEESLGSKLKWHYAISDQLRWDLPPTEAQALWLDKVLELAIEAGMVKP